MDKKQQNKLYDLITDKIREERKKRGISQLKLALLLGYNSTSHIAKIELRKSGANYQIVHLYIIAKEFNLKLAELLPDCTELDQ